MSIVRDADFTVTNRVPTIEVQDRQLRADIYLPQMVLGVGRGLCIDVSRVHDFHGNAANPFVGPGLIAVKTCVDMMCVRIIRATTGALPIVGHGSQHGLSLIHI